MEHTLLPCEQRNEKRKQLEKALTIGMILACITIGVIESIEDGESIVGGFALGSSDALHLLAYILILKTPLLGLASLLGSSIFSLVYTVGINGDSLMDSLTGTLLVLLAITVHLCIIEIGKKKQRASEKIESNRLVDVESDSETDSKKKISIIKTIKEDMMIERKPFKVVWWIQLNLYLFMFITVMVVANSEEFTNMFHVVGFNTYGAIAMMLPIFELIGMLTTSVITYRVYWFKILIEIFTLVIIASFGEMRLTLVAFVMIEIGIAIAIKVKNAEKQKEA